MGIIAQVSEASSNETAQVTTAWMAGVVGMMLVFGVVALFGYLRKQD